MSHVSVTSSTSDWLWTESGPAVGPTSHFIAPCPPAPTQAAAGAIGASCGSGAAATSPGPVDILALTGDCSRQEPEPVRQSPVRDDTNLDYLLITFTLSDLDSFKKQFTVSNSKDSF